MIIPENQIILPGDYNSKTFYVATSRGTLRQMPIPMRV